VNCDCDAVTPSGGSFSVFAMFQHALSMPWLSQVLLYCLIDGLGGSHVPEPQNLLLGQPTPHSVCDHPLLLALLLIPRYRYVFSVPTLSLPSLIDLSSRTLQPISLIYLPHHPPLVLSMYRLLTGISAMPDLIYVLSCSVHHHFTSSPSTLFRGSTLDAANTTTFRAHHCFSRPEHQLDADPRQSTLECSMPDV
jgi:hypothetical protein